jgi:tetratricopeptide (TPR) repeat protein
MTVSDRERRTAVRLRTERDLDKNSQPGPHLSKEYARDNNSNGVIRSIGLLVCSAAVVLIAVVRVGAQAGLPLDIPETGDNPSMLMGVPLDPPDRARVEEALKGRQYDRAEAILLGQYNKNPRSAPLLVLLGRIFFLDKKYENCAIALKKAEKLSPLEDRYHFKLAMAYVAMKHPDWARPEIERLMRADPNKALYPYWVSRLDYHDKRVGDAVTHIQRAIQLDPKFMKAYDNLGLYLEYLGKYDKAILAYQTAIRLNRADGLHSPWPTHNLGALLTELGRLDEAEPYLKESVQEDPKFPKAYFQLGKLLEKRMQDDDAIKVLKQAIDLDPHFAEPYYVLGRILQRRHDSETAREALDTFKKLKDHDDIPDLSK